MSVISVDLLKNPELAALVADKQPGDWIELRASIKARDSQTVQLRLQECDDCEKPASDDDEEDDDAGDDESPAEEAPVEKPTKSLARKLTGSDDMMM